VTYRMLHHLLDTPLLRLQLGHPQQQLKIAYHEERRSTRETSNLRLQILATGLPLSHQFQWKDSCYFQQRERHISKATDF